MIKTRRIPATKTGAQIADALVTAAEQLLSECGLEQFSTNRIARRAGVSVGSLYQYFPNKEALLAEVARRMERRTESAFVETLAACRELPLEATVDRVIGVLLGEGLGSLQLRQTIRREVPSSWVLDTSVGVDETVRNELARELARRDDVRKGPIALMTWLAAHAVELVVEHAVLTSPELLELPVFRRELVELVVSYLGAPGRER